jgi:predicted transposase/invertase (TIGR01784 family)
MPEEPIHHPNDKLLKATFSNPDNARGFFQNYLPTQISHAVDWNSLRLESSTFVDPHFAASESDLLFSLKLAQSDAFLYLLFEHQSSEDPRMALRLLSYILRIWERFAAAHPAPAKLPAILPIVLAQGKRPWKTAPRLEDLIDLPAELADIIRPWQPTLMYRLLELVRIPYEELAGTPEGIMTLRALKAEPLEELLSDALWEESLLFAISDSALERMLRYILNADLNISLLKERLKTIRSKPLQTKTMTLADQLRLEGKEEGKLEGLSQGLSQGLSEGQLRAFRTAVQRALEIRHASCPEGIREALDAIGDPKRLEQLHEIAFRSESLEAFAQKL